MAKEEVSSDTQIKKLKAELRRTRKELAEAKEANVKQGENAQNLVNKMEELDMALGNERQKAAQIAASLQAISQQHEGYQLLIIRAIRSK